MDLVHRPPSKIKNNKVDNVRLPLYPQFLTKLHNNSSMVKTVFRRQMQERLHYLKKMNVRQS